MLLKGKVTKCNSVVKSKVESITQKRSVESMICHLIFLYAVHCKLFLWLPLCRDSRPK